MNWVDVILIGVLLGSVIIGSKKGLIREITAFIVFFVAIIISVNYIDNFAVYVYQQVGGSPLISAFLSFVILLAATYAAFKILGLLFYKVANIKDSGKRDQMGGALVGFLRGWIAAGFVTFLVFLLPMPEAFYTAFDASFFGPTIAKTVPLMYETTSKIHPSKPDFMEQIEKTLLVTDNDKKWDDNGDLKLERAEIHKVLYRMEQVFTTDLKSDEGS